MFLNKPITKNEIALLYTGKYIQASQRRVLLLSAGYRLLNKHGQ